MDGLYSSFGRKDVQESIRFFTPELEAMDSHDFSFENGRIFIIDTAAGELVNIRQMSGRIDGAMSFELMKRNLTDTEKAARILRYFADIIVDDKKEHIKGIGTGSVSLAS